MTLSNDPEFNYVRNEMSGTVDGPLVQAGAIHGDVIVNYQTAALVKPRQIPPASPHFVGRKKELELLQLELTKRLADGNVLLPVVVSGAAGIGKTALIFEWLGRVEKFFLDGSIYLDLGAFSSSGDPVDLPSAIRYMLDALNFPADRLPVSDDARLSLLRSILSRRRMIIVLDNAYDSEQVIPLVYSSTTCLSVIASRRKLHGLVVQKGGLVVNLDAFNSEESKALLTSYLGPQTISRERAASEEIVKFCSGLPLALTIIAARILISPATAIADVAANLNARRSLNELETGEASASLKAVLDYSYIALDEAAARLLRLLGVHRGADIDRLCAASIIGMEPEQIHPLLSSLVQINLVEEYSPGRYRFHDLVRLYVSEKLAAEEPGSQSALALRRDMDYYLHTSFAAARLMDPQREPIHLPEIAAGVTLPQLRDYDQALNWFSSERQNLISLVHHAAGTGETFYAWAIPWALADFLDRRGYWADWLSTQRVALEAAERLNDSPVEARIHRQLAWAYLAVSNYDQAAHHATHAMNVCRDLGDPSGEAHGEHLLAWILSERGDYRTSIDHALRALTSYRELGLRPAEGDALNNLAWYYSKTGNLEKSLECAREAMSIYNSVGNVRGEGLALDTLSCAYQALGRFAEAIHGFRNAIDIYRQVGDRLYEARTLARMGEAYKGQNMQREAEDSLEEALDILEELGHESQRAVRAELRSLTQHEEA